MKMQRSFMTLLLSLLFMSGFSQNGSELSLHLQKYFYYKPENTSYWKHRAVSKIVLYDLSVTDYNDLNVYKNIELLVFLNCTITDLQNFPKWIKKVCLINCRVSPECLSKLNVEKLKLLKTSVRKMPQLSDSIKELTVVNCDAESIKSLPVSLERFFCAGNNLSHLPDLPLTLKYLNCSYNHLKRIPKLPYGIETLICGKNKISKLSQLPQSLNQVNAFGNKLHKLPDLPENLRLLNYTDNKIRNHVYRPNINCDVVNSNFLEYVRYDCPEKIKPLAEDIANAYMNVDYYRYIKHKNDYSHFSFVVDSEKSDSLEKFLEYIEDSEHWDIYEADDEQFFMENATVYTDSRCNILKDVILLEDTLHENCGTLNLILGDEFSFETRNILLEDIQYPENISPFVFEGFYQGRRKVSMVSNTQDTLPDKMPDDFQIIVKDSKHSYTLHSEYNFLIKYGYNGIATVYLTEEEKKEIYKLLQSCTFLDHNKYRKCSTPIYVGQSNATIPISIYWNRKTKFLVTSIEDEIICDEELKKEFLKEKENISIVTEYIYNIVKERKEVKKLKINKSYVEIETL